MTNTLSEEELGEIVGGTLDENLKLATVLWLCRYGTFGGHLNPDGTDIDYGAIEKFLAEKGCKLVRGDGDVPNMFYTPDGTPLAQDALLQVIMHRKL